MKNVFNYWEVRPRTVVLIAISLMACLFIFVKPSKVHAQTTFTNGNEFPQYIKDGMTALCFDPNWGSDVVQATWISMAGDPLETTIKVSFGNQTVNLQYNVAIARCKYGVSTNIDNTVYTIVREPYEGSYQYTSFKYDVYTILLADLIGKSVTVTSPTTYGAQYAYNSIPFSVDLSSLRTDMNV